MKLNSNSSWRNGHLVIIPAFAALISSLAPASAGPILGNELASFAVLGAATVTNTGATTLAGNLGVSPGTAITGFFGTTANEGPGLVTGVVHQTDAFAGLAQTQLGIARTNLGLMGAGSILSADLVGLTLTPGVYTVAAGVSNLTGALTLDGQGNANAAWVFQMVSTLITSPGSVVNVINTGTGAGVYWNVASSATLDTTTSFQGNILALASITLNNGATIGCGRALANTGAVTMINNTITIGCAGTGEEGSGGLSGGLDVSTTENGTVVSFLPSSVESAESVPEPASMLLLLGGLTGMAGFARFRRYT